LINISGGTPGEISRQNIIIFSMLVIDPFPGYIFGAIQRRIKVDEKMILFERVWAGKKAGKTVPFELANAEKNAYFCSW